MIWTHKKGVHKLDVQNQYRFPLECYISKAFAHNLLKWNSMRSFMIQFYFHLFAISTPNERFILFKQKGNYWLCSGFTTAKCPKKKQSASWVELKAERGKSGPKMKCIYHKSLQFMVIATHFGKVSVCHEFPFKTWLCQLVFHYSFQVCCSLSADLPRLGKA